MNTVPKAQPPSTMCHQNGTPNHGFVCEPIALKTSDIAIVPTATPAIERHDAIRVTSSSTAPSRQASAEVSPIDPGSSPMNAFHHEKPADSNGCVITRICPRSVAPEKPSTATSGGTAVQTLSPEISAGYAKNRKARAASAGLMKFIPVPPNTSLARMTPKLMPSAACHKGVVG